MNLSNRYVWIVLAFLVLIATAVLLRIPQTGASAEKENQQKEILQVFAEAHINAVRSVGDPAFAEYVAGPLQKVCPFYVPDGVTYRDCLSGLVEREKAAYVSSKSDIKSFVNYCQSKSDQYTGVETLNLYFSCMAYKLNAL